jgi:hypothetical protein
MYDYECNDILVNVYIPRYNSIVCIKYFNSKDAHVEFDTIDSKNQ